MTNFCSFENAQSLMTGIKDKLDEKVMSVNGITPDTDGNVAIPDFEYISGQDYGFKYHNLAVKTPDMSQFQNVLGIDTDTEGNIHTFNVFDVPIDTYTLELEGGVKTVDNQQPDTNGNVPLLPLYKNGFQVRKEWPAYDKYDLDYDNDRRSYIDNNGSSSTITSMGYGNIILTGTFLEHRNEFTIPTTLSAYSTYNDYMKWVVYNATTTSEQIPINDTQVYIGDKIEVIFNKPDRKVFVFGANGKLKLNIDLT